MSKVYIYDRFERFWHWSQAFLVLNLLITGFEIHGFWELWGFKRAFDLHVIFAWALLGLWAFAIFWHFTTGNWRHYVPTLKQLPLVVRFYAWDVFRGKPHPYHKTPQAKLNPLQRLAYLGLKLAINPAIIVTGLLLLYAGAWDDLLPLRVVALAHTAAAFAMAAFVMIHVYLTTTGHTVFEHIKAMITGFEDLDHQKPPAKPS